MSEWLALMHTLQVTATVFRQFVADHLGCLAMSDGVKSQTGEVVMVNLTSSHLHSLVIVILTLSHLHTDRLSIYF